MVSSSDSSSFVSANASISCLNLVSRLPVFSFFPPSLVPIWALFSFALSQLSERRRSLPLSSSPSLFSSPPLSPLQFFFGVAIFRWWPLRVRATFEPEAPPRGPRRPRLNKVGRRPGVRSAGLAGRGIPRARPDGGLRRTSPGAAASQLVRDGTSRGPDFGGPSRGRSPARVDE